MGVGAVCVHVFAVADELFELAVKLRLISVSRYYVLPVGTETYCVCVGAVSNGDAVSFYQLAEAEGWTKNNKYMARYVG